MNSDIVVVGAGPAGCYSAFQAAKLGAQVTICEEHGKIGSPSHCTGHVSIEGLRRFGLRIPENVFENEIESAIFYSPSGYHFSVRFPSPVTCVINRVLFDQFLSDLALEAGVTILRDTYVDHLWIEKDSVGGVVVKRKRNAGRLTSGVVIDAEGVSSRLLKRSGLFHFDHGMIVNGVQAEVDKLDGATEDAVEVFLSHDFAPGFFGWIVPRRDGTAKVGLGAAKGNPRDCFRHFMRHNPIARQRLKRSHVTGLVYHPIPLNGPICRTFHNGLLIVGDAASQVKPTTGGGIIMGLTCAEIAGTVAAYAVRHNDFAEHSLFEYERQWRKKIGFDMTVMKHLRSMLNSFSDKQLDKFIALCTRLRLDEDLRDVREVDFQGTSLIRLGKSPRMLATMLYLLASSLL